MIGFDVLRWVLDVLRIASAGAHLDNLLAVLFHL